MRKKPSKTPLQKAKDELRRLKRQLLETGRVSKSEQVSHQTAAQEWRNQKAVLEQRIDEQGERLVDAGNAITKLTNRSAELGRQLQEKDLNISVLLKEVSVLRLAAAAKQNEIVAIVPCA